MGLGDCWRVIIYIYIMVGIVDDMRHAVSRTIGCCSPTLGCLLRLCIYRPFLLEIYLLV